MVILREFQIQNVKRIRLFKSLFLKDYFGFEAATEALVSHGHDLQFKEGID